MSNYEQKNGTGTIWKNDKYTVGGNQPYAKGTIKDLNGNNFEVALWIPKSDKAKGFNFTMQEPYKKNAEPDTAKVSNPLLEEDDNDLPW